MALFIQLAVHYSLTIISSEGSFLQYFPEFLPKFYSNSEAKALELLENLEEMYPRYYMLSFKFPITQQCNSRLERVLTFSV